VTEANGQWNCCWCVRLPSKWWSCRKRHRSTRDFRRRTSAVTLAFTTWRPSWKPGGMFVYVVGLRVTLDLGINSIFWCLIVSWFHCSITERFLLRAKDFLLQVTLQQPQSWLSFLNCYLNVNRNFNNKCIFYVHLFYMSLLCVWDLEWWCAEIECRWYRTICHIGATYFTGDNITTRRLSLRTRRLLQHRQTHKLARLSFLIIQSSFCLTDLSLAWPVLFHCRGFRMSPNTRVLCHNITVNQGLVVCDLWALTLLVGSFDP